jgi:DNA-binding NarL/FixJ family response regulator
MLVDDHPMWRQTVKQVLEHKGVAKVVAEASDGAEAIALANRTPLDIVVMDIDLPSVDGVEATRRLLAARPELKVLVLSASDARAQVIAAVQAGASGYLLKTSGPGEVAEAIQRVRAGELVFPPALAGLVLDEMRRVGVRAATGTRVAVVGDSVVRREGLARLVAEGGFEVVAIGRIAKLGEMIDADPPELVILDVGSRADTGLRAAVELRGSRPEVGLLVLSEDPEAAEAVELLSEAPHGLGYLLTDRVNDLDELAEAVRRVANGESVVDPAVVSRLVDRPEEETPLGELTESERSVLALMAEGRSNQAIAEQLFLSPKTVESRVGNIFSKLGLEPTGDDHRRVLAVIAYLRSV